MKKYTNKQAEQIAAMIFYFREFQNLKDMNDPLYMLMKAQYKAVTPENIRNKVNEFLEDISKLEKVMERIELEKEE